MKLFLDMPEPSYEYDFGKRFIPVREKYPVRQVFNWYIEDYKDIKEINEEVMKEYLKQISPFEEYPEQLKYPGVEPRPESVPRWYNYEFEDIKYRRQKWDIVPYKFSSLKIQDSKYLKSLPYQIHENYKIKAEEAVQTVVAAKTEKKQKKNVAKK
jgi:hypothetical protein